MSLGIGRYVFFLGGHDLEMETIADLLEELHATYCYKKLNWGAKASAYKDEIGHAIKANHTPVIVELLDDVGLPPESIVIVDHHGVNAGASRKSSLRQVFELLGLPEKRWDRRLMLVSANDVGYIPALVEAGASKEEITEIRAADRKAQGITSEQESQGEEAITMAETLCGGRLTVVRLPHSKTGVVSDRLQPELGGPGCINLLVISSDEVNFFGEGWLVKALIDEFPDGWYGGALPDRGFWGHGLPLPDITGFLRRKLCV